MARYTGLSNQEILRIIKSDTENKIKDIVSRTVENIQNLEITYGNRVVYSTTKDIKPNFWDYVAIAPSLGYSLFKGGLEVINSGFWGIVRVIAQGINNIIYAFKESEDAEDFFKRQLPFVITDFTGQIGESLGVAMISAAADAGKLFGADSDWAYKEGGVIEDWSNLMLAFRVGPLKGRIVRTSENDMFNPSIHPALRINMTYVKNPMPEIRKANEEKEENQELLAGRYYAETEKFIRNSVSWQNWISENMIEPSLGILVGAKEHTDIVFGDSQVYNLLMGTAESVGNILTTILLAKLTANYFGTSNAETAAKVLSNVYFASSVFGKSFQEAINNGVSVDDAYTYAWGNALIETGIENIGGFTPSGEIVGANSIYEQISKSTLKDFVKNAAEEGLEEFVSGLASTGLERYANPDRKIDYHENPEDLWADLAFQFLGGALASAGINFGRNVYLNLSNNLDYKADKLINDFHKQVKIEGEELALKRFEKHLNQVVDALNSTNARGIVEGENQAVIKKMTLEDKKNFLNRTGLVLLIEEQNGKFQIRERFKDKMTADMFKNKIGTKVVDENVYAVNSMTRGVDLTHNNLVKENELVKIENMNEIEKRAYDFANQRNVPIVFFNSADGDSFYGNNGVIYINTKSLNENNIEETILRHEMVHKIKDTDIELYETIKNKVDSLIELSFDKDTKLPSLKFANETLEKMFKESGHDKRIIRTFAEKLEVLKDLETAIEQTKEEIVAHFIEETLKGGNIIDILSFDKPNIVKQLMNRLTQNKELKAIAEGNKKITKELKEIRNLFEKALKKTVDSEQRLKFFFNHALGINFDFDLRIFQAEEFKNNFKKEILDKHPIELIVSGYIHDYDYVEGTVVIEGTKYHISEVLKQNAFENANPEYVKTPDEENIQKTFRYQKEKENTYKRILERFINESEQQDKIELAKQTLEQIEQGKQIKDEHKDLLRELYSQYEFALNERSSYRQHIGDNDIISKETQKVISYINEDFSAYKNIFEYRPYAYGLKAGAYGYIELQQNETPDMHLNLISTYVHKKFGENFEIDSKVKNNVLEVVISPTQEYIRDLMPSEKTELQHYKSNINELTEEQKQMVKELFDEYAEGVISEIFDVDKKGNLIPKNRRVLSTRKEVNKVKLVDGRGKATEYDGSTYAVRTYFDMSEVNINRPHSHGFKEPLKLEDMTKEEKTLHDTFRTTQMNYVLYRGGRNGTVGFTFGDKDNYITYINTSYIEEGFQRLASTLLHETVHRIYDFKQEDAVKFAKQLAELLFVKKENGTIEKSTVLEHLEKEVYSRQFPTDSFLNYMQNSYPAGRRYAQLNSYKDIYDIMTKDKHNAKESNILDELIAQFTGHLLMTDSIYKEVLKGRSLVDSSAFRTTVNIYHQIMNDTSINNDTKKIFKITLKSFGKLYEKFIVELRKKFPNETTLYDLKYINDFISEFTDGEFTTRGKLLNAYFKEKANKKRGNATIAIDNLIYVASILGENIQRGVNVYNKLKSEFENFKANVEIILNHPDGIFLLEDARIKFRRVNSTIEKISEIVKLGELNDTSLFKELRTTLDELHNLYEQIPNEIKEIYGLPSLDEVTKAIDFVQLEIDKVIDYFDYGYEFPNMQDFLDSTAKAFNKIFKNLSTTLDDAEIFGAIKKLQVEYRKKTINDLLDTIEKKVNSTVNQIATRGRQKGVLFAKDLQEIVDLVDEFHLAIANNAFNYSEMKKVLADVLTKIRNKIISSERFSQIDKQTLINNELLIIHLQFAYLFNDSTFVTDYYTGEGFEYLQQLPISKIVKQFSPDKVATQLSRIINFFRTDFKSGFNKNFTIEEYTAHTKQQIRDLMKEGIQFKTEHLSALSHYMLPQDFLFMYSELTQGRVDFFNDFYREYVNAAKRRMAIFQEFDMSYKAWLKDHKKAIDYSFEKVDISPEIITYVRSTNEINEIKRQITQEMNAIDDEISKFEKNVEELKTEIKILGEEIKELKNQKDKIADKKSPQYKALHQKQKELEQQQSEKRKEIKGFTEKIYELKEEKNNISFEDRVRAKLDQVAKSVKDKQKITKGDLIALYLSVAREVEMHKIYETDSTIAPTNHFHFGNTIWFVDSKVIVEKGLEVAKNKARQFVIYTQDREELLNQLEQMIKNDYMAQEILAFAKERFDKNYEYVNEIYSDMYGVDLPKQPTYIPFVALDSSPTREFEFARLHRHNQGVAEGMTMRTTLGASVPLQIENIFGVIEKQSKEVQNYSFHRIIEDWQHLLVHKGDPHDTPFGELIKGEGNVFGVDNGIQRMIEKMFLNILQYRDIYESNLSKKIRKMFINTSKAIFALNIKSAAKQFGSVGVIVAKNKINLSTLSKNTLAATMPTRNKYRTWLMKNNPHFYQRAISGNNAALADQISFTFAENAWLKIMKPVRKYVDKLSIMGWVDNAIIVGAFKSYADVIRKQNPQLTEQQVLEKANEMLDEVLMYGVASTDSAFRAPFSNSKNPIDMLFSRYLSEGVMQHSSMIRHLYLRKNGVKSSRSFKRDVTALLAAAFWEALVNAFFWEFLRGAGDEEEFLEKLTVEFIMSGLLGSIPVVNVFVNAISVYINSGNITFDEGYSLTIPGVEDIIKGTQILASMSNGKNVERKLLRAFEHYGQVLGLPVKNISRITSTAANLLKRTGNKTARDVDAFFHSENKSQAYYRAIRENRRSVINSYVEDVYSNIQVRNEIVELLMRNPDKQIKIYDVDSFYTVTEDGKRIHHKIPENIKKRYVELTQRALQRLISNYRYRKFNDEYKIKTIQRIINYYYNHMKEVILKNKKPHEIDDVMKVVERALSISEREIEEKRKKA